VEEFVELKYMLIGGLDRRRDKERPGALFPADKSFPFSEFSAMMSSFDLKITGCETGAR
jgi:hypothetical protein